MHEYSSTFLDNFAYPLTGIHELLTQILTQTPVMQAKILMGLVTHMQLLIFELTLMHRDLTVHNRENMSHSFLFEQFRVPCCFKISEIQPVCNQINV